MTNEPRPPGDLSPTELLDEYDITLIAWRELDHDARPRHEALRAELERRLAPTMGVEVHRGGRALD